jgi:tRNA 5-methylaminomethyl-2-thiouridine biosynthesis bifunctional protein
VLGKNKFSCKEDGSPFSLLFDDIYFDTASGSDQSYRVFIEGNNIKQKLETAVESFIIAETGFGTGLNFLLTLQLYQQLSVSKPLAPLTFISTEKYPLTAEQLKMALACLPMLTDVSSQLIAQYQPAIVNYRSEQSIVLKFFNNLVTLVLMLDDSTAALSKLAVSEYGPIDAWYLDGFAPSKNPEMWQDSLFEQMARLSKVQASLSTFTISGKVRRALTKVGFRLNKIKTNGQKKEILTGKFQQSKHNNSGYKIRPTITKPQQVSIIGGGIASACAAYVLTQNGIKVTLYCKDSQVAQGASNNDIAAVYPLIHQQKDPISAFYHQAFDYAIDFYHDLLKQGYHFAHDWCGLLDVSYKEPLEIRQKHFEQGKVWPGSLILSVDKNKASLLTGIKLNHGGLFYPKAGWIAPRELVAQLFAAAKKTNRLRIETNHQICALNQRSDKSWQLVTHNSNIAAGVVIICGGADTIPLNIMKELPLTPVRGQVSTVKSNATMSALKTVICHKGYLTPVHNQTHCIGATFDKNNLDIQSHDADDEYNIATLARCLPSLNAWNIDDVIRSKARLRCTTPDHIPVVGAMPDVAAHRQTYAHLSKDKNWRYQQPAPCIDNLYVLTGLGARGLCSAPLLAEILKDDLCGTPYSIDNDMLFNLAPNRFVIRELIKNK